jgi:hypothetical protein
MDMDNTVPDLIQRYLIQAWLRWLKDECGLRTAAFMVDCAVTESEAISTAFPDARILYCDFHVAQLWERHLKEERSVWLYVHVCAIVHFPTTGLAQKFSSCTAYAYYCHDRERKEMRPLLKMVYKSPIAMDQRRLWGSFKERFPEATTLIDYIEKNWLKEHLERWAVFHRLVCMVSLSGTSKE